MNLGRFDDPFDGTLEEVEPDRNDDDRDHQAGHILHAAVPERVLVVGGLGREARPEERDHRRTRVGQVVDGIRHHRDAAGQQTDRQLHGEQQKVAHDPDRTAENAVGLPDTLVGRAPGVLYEQTNQQSGQGRTPFLTRLSRR